MIKIPWCIMEIWWFSFAEVRFLPIDWNSVSSSSKSRQFPKLNDFNENSLLWDESMCIPLQSRFFFKTMLPIFGMYSWICIAAMLSKITESFEDNLCICGQCDFWCANHLKVIVQQHSQVLFSCFWRQWASEQCISAWGFRFGCQFKSGWIQMDKASWLQRSPNMPY